MQHISGKNNFGNLPLTTPNSTCGIVYRMTLILDVQVVTPYQPTMTKASKKGGKKMFEET